MLQLDLAAGPRWLDLGHGVRLRVTPLTTALMVAARSDPALEALPDDRLRRGAGARLRQGDRPDRGQRLGGRRRCRRHPGAGHARGHRRAPRGLADLRGVPGGPTSPAACCWTRKKTSPRPRRLALRRGRPLLRGLRTRPCPDCPARLNRPETFDGWQVWDLALRLGGQLRVVPGAVIGWDLGAALALAAALGIAPLVAAELLPEIEAVMVKKLNEQVGDSDG